MKEETNEFLYFEYVNGQYDAVVKWRDYSQVENQPLLWIKPRPQITGFVIPTYSGFMLECANSGKYLKSDKSYKGSIVGMYVQIFMQVLILSEIIQKNLHSRE